MAVLVCCPNCKRPAQVPQDSAGKTVRCTGCKATFKVPLGSGELMIEWGPIGAGRRVPLVAGKKATIGRTKDNTVSLPGPLVSRRHATLVWADSEWMLRDAGSTNGTFVNGQRVKAVGLTDGSRIVIGDFALRLNVASTGPSELEKALDAMALSESKVDMLAVVDVREGAGAPADTRAETVMGDVPLSAPEDDSAVPALPARGLLERWPVVVGLAVVVVIVVVLLIRWLG